MVYTINDTQLVRLMLYHEMLEDNWILNNSDYDMNYRNHIMQILAETSADGDYHTKHQNILNQLESLYKKYIKYKSFIQQKQISYELS